MGYRIDYTQRGPTMSARISGKSSLPHAAGIAREIADEATRRTVEQLVIDVRGLIDRVGILATLVLGACAPNPERKVALVDTLENDRYHALSEGLAQRRGYALRCFDDPQAAIEWLQRR